jgi:hypothetical protein
MEDQGGMRAIGVAVAALALDPYHRRVFTGVNITGCAWASSGSFMRSRKT